MGWRASETADEVVISGGGRASGRRPMLEKRVWLTALVTAFMSARCAGPEQEVIDRYLEATQRGDNDTVSALSMVAFPEDVASWNVLAVGVERREPYRVPALREALETAEEARDTQSNAFGEFRQQNYEGLRRIGARLDDEPDYHFPGRMGELQDQWEAFREERRRVDTDVHHAEIALEQELRQVNKSLQRESSAEELTGETRVKDVRVRVTTPAGDEHFIITLTRYELENQFDALVPAGWIVTAVAALEE